MSYVTKDDLRNWVRLSDNVTNDELRLEAAAAGANAAVDLYCGRSFVPTVTGGGAPSPTSRIYRSLYMDDVSDATGLVVEVSQDRTNWTTVNASGYWLGPEGVAYRPIPEPYTCVVPIDGATWPFYPLAFTSTPFDFEQFMRVTTNKWGWPGTEVHPNVTLAARLMGAWLYERSNAPFALVGSDLPVRIARNGDPDACNLLSPLRRSARVRGV